MSLRLSAADEPIFQPYSVRFEDVRARIDQGLPAKDRDEPPYRETSSGLLIRDFTRGEEVSTANRLAPVFSSLLGAKLVLASKIKKFATPIFSGIVLDQNEDAIANFKVITRFDDTNHFVELVELAADKIERYSADPSRFARVAYGTMLQARGYDRKAAVDQIWIASAGQRNKYEEIVRWMQTTLALFKPGRPTWILADLGHHEPLDQAHLRRLTSLTSDDHRYVDLILIFHQRHLISIRDGRVTRHEPPDCVSEFGR